MQVMKKLITGLFLCAIVASACKSNVNPRDILAGTWQLHKLTEVDTTRRDCQNPPIYATQDADSIVMVLNPDGTGTSTLPQATMTADSTSVVDCRNPSHSLYKHPFTWVLENNYLKVTDKDHTNSLLITKISSSSITLKDTSMSPCQLETFVKQ